jgi:hypothetical protein
MVAVRDSILDTARFSTNEAKPEAAASATASLSL